MATVETISHDQLGQPGEGCPVCAAPLAPDQRYCLECGHRRAAARVPYAELLSGREPEDVLPQAPGADPPPPPARPFSPLAAAAASGGAVLLLVLGIAVGVLIGGTGDDAQPVAAPVAQKPPIVNITNTGGGGGEAVEEEFVEDWPAGENGFTVQLEVLPKDGTDIAAVDAAKSDAESQGASEVGALDSDGYTSLEPGNYVVYSGTFTGKGAKGKAQAALKKLKKDFPDAKMVKVTSADAVFDVEGELPEEQAETVDDSVLEDLESSTGVDQQKKSSKLPDTLQLPGEAPPEDNGEAGGGSEGDVIE